MSDYHFAGVNVWTYSLNRAIAWFGLKGSHYSDPGKHYLTYQRGGAGCIGIEITVGGEDREVMIRLGLLLATFYIGITGLTSSNRQKVEAAAKQQKCYSYEVDFSDQGRTTGVMLSFGELGGLQFRLWEDPDKWTSRTIREKFQCFPYCEGVGKKFYWRNP